MGLMTGLLLILGQAFAGRTGLIIMAGVSVVMNFISYWFSADMVLKAYRAQEVQYEDSPELFRIVDRLARRAVIPMPKVYIIQSEVPNAFATGRSPSHAAVVVTTGILDLLTDDEIEGVLGHELAHIIHRDTLISTVAASMAGIVSTIANIAQWGMIFGHSDREDRNPLAMIATIVLAPIAAFLIQMGISRSREYLADEGGATLSGKPLALASALQKIDTYARYGVVANASPSSAHMFIINPFQGHNINFSSLFSTHPSTEERIRRLREMANKR